MPAPDQERTLELFGYEACGYCRRVLRALERMPELEVTFRDTWRERGAAQVLRERTGRSQVPCLFVDGEALFESEDIVRWLEAYQEWLAATPA